MEFNFLLNSSQRSKTFAHFTVTNNVLTRANSDYKYSGFYYVGKNSSSIERLVSLYKRGYASDHIEDAKIELSRCLTQEKNSIPEVIFCESHFDLHAIKSLGQFLARHEVFSSIPFIVDSSDLSEAKLAHLRKHKLADDIVLLKNTDDKIIASKIQFLSKIKAKSSRMQIDHSMMTKMIATFSANMVMKRTVDIVLSAIALLLLSPLFLLIALAISLESRGPVFYISKRAGKGYHIFNFYKFRTMRVGADKSMDEFSHLNQYNANPGGGPVFFKFNNDPRVTKVGAMLRNCSLDELPQLFNVLLGDMSLVGNRPLPLYEAATLTTDEYAQRFLAPAGITGLWQIKKRGKENMSVHERITLDIDYANKNNFVYDLWIMANTPSALMQKESV